MAAGSAPLLLVGVIGVGSAGAGTSSTIPTVAESPSLAGAVPASIKSSGTLSVALDATYAPDEFVASDGSTVIGMDADLANAIGQVLNLKVTLTNATFATIIPALTSGKFDLGMSSFTDTKAREKQVNFVDYFSAGEGYYVSAKSHYHPNGLSALCGHSVSVESGTTEESDAQAQAKICKHKKKAAVKVLSFANQNSANLAVSSGRADVGFADSQIAQYIVAQSGGQFRSSGKAFETAPYGIAVPKGTTLNVSVQGALKVLIADGTYGKILKKWGIQAGAVKTAALDGATS
ncbi:MAG TPA: ABC transporter substrate-binding protein [Acidimicrobiales bacterium]|nr:ABC transporter substrate-binding protein [Acidimicrobiales bacterium]